MSRARSSTLVVRPYPPPPTFSRPKPPLPNQALTVSDSEVGLTRPERQALLRRRWGFTCTCALCGLTESEVLASDARRERTREIRDRVLAHVHQGEYGEAVRWHGEIIGLLAEEGISVPMGEHYDTIARLSMAAGDHRGALRWAEMAIEDLEM